MSNENKYYSCLHAAVCMLRSLERKAVGTDEFLSRSLPPLSGMQEVEVLKEVEGAAVTSPSGEGV